MPVSTSGNYYSKTYGYFDRSHFGKDVRSLARYVIEQVKANREAGGTFEVGPQNYNLGPFSGSIYARYAVAPYDPAVYLSPDHYVKGVALGIFEDFQVRFEKFEGGVAGYASFWLTGFAAEDLPSEYLAFVMVAESMTEEEAFSYLGPLQSVDKPPRDLGWSHFNPSFFPRVNGDYVIWPNELLVAPIGQETGAWKLLGQSTNESVASQVIGYFFGAWFYDSYYDRLMK